MMVAQDTYDILLLALAQAFAQRTDAFVMLEQIDRAIRKYETGNNLPKRHSSAVTTALIELDGLGLITINRGRVRLTPEGILGCQDLELPADWAGLPAALKPYVKS